MPSLHHSTDEPHEDSRRCPNCGNPATAAGGYSRQDEPTGLATVYYVCDREHLWSLRYMTGVRD